MEILYFLESIRIPPLDFFFSLITHIGGETVFLAVAITFFWCVNKKEGYYILITGLIGTTINQFMKLAFRIDRPWVHHHDLHPIESAIPEATGYSFPSGHTQNVAGTFGAIGTFSRRKWVKTTAVIIIVLVSFSRMYLGVHTPYDVVASLLLASLILLILHPIFTGNEKFHKLMPIVILASFLITLGLVLYTFSVDEMWVDYDNLISARENSMTLFGSLLGLMLVYPLDRYVIDFKTDGKWYSQLLKLSLGLGIVVLMKALLKPLLELIFPSVYLARAIRYFLIVVFAGFLYPLTFKYYSKIKIKCLDDFTEKLAGKLKKRS